MYGRIDALLWRSSWKCPDTHFFNMLKALDLYDPESRYMKTWTVGVHFDVQLLSILTQQVSKGAPEITLVFHYDYKRNPTLLLLERKRKEKKNEPEDLIVDFHRTDSDCVRPHVLPFLELVEKVLECSLVDAWVLHRTLYSTSHDQFWIHYT